MIPELKEKNYKVLGIGEVMLRLSPVGKERISYCETFEKKAGGSELNVVSGVSMLGLRTGIITKLPKTEIGKFIKLKIRYSGTSDDFVIYDRSPDKRLGVYYYESGAYPRLPVVSYDRANSSFTTFILYYPYPQLLLQPKVHCPFDFPPQPGPAASLILNGFINPFPPAKSTILF